MVTNVASEVKAYFVITKIEQGKEEIIAITPNEALNIKLVDSLLRHHYLQRLGVMTDTVEKVSIAVYKFYYNGKFYVYKPYP